MPSRTSTLLQTPTAAHDGSEYLSSSLSGLLRSRSTNNLIVKAYKQATQLYLTRRFREAWDVIEPVVSPRQSSIDDRPALSQENDHVEPAPIAQSSRGTRTKVWVFYLSLVHAVVELGAEEGKQQFGSELWRGIVAKAREGSIWEEVVQRGYAGMDGEVDAEVIVNLSTLLLGHMPTQTLNQRRMEAYLAASEDVGQMGWDGTSTPMSTHSASPKALQARLKILELYTLHVLPETGEWDYAKQFIEVNDSLDEERKEAYLHALDSLKEEREGNVRREKELQVQREKEQTVEMERRRKEESVRQQEEERRRAAIIEEREQQHRDNASRPTTSGPYTASNGSKGGPANGTVKPKLNDNNRQPSRSNRGPPSAPRTTMTLITRLSSQVQSLVQLTRQNIGSPRLLVFILAFLLLAARRDLRVRLRRALDASWDKVRRTIGMGVKVSYV
jgi:hypothetical protein